MINVINKKFRDDLVINMPDNKYSLRQGISYPCKENRWLLGSLRPDKAAGRAALDSGEHRQAVAVGPVAAGMVHLRAWSCRGGDPLQGLRDLWPNFA